MLTPPIMMKMNDLGSKQYKKRTKKTVVRLFITQAEILRENKG